ncbi:predicted protein [Lichtheimia corymbifera JMRC:FSU:9682]|uniref:F-box domain-containing protein n=1 Tax=Lichtheimia corymbifera JMRC:FSU:9682 TaxID=1263082 RepID=A0A068RR39_9FUNG|nr:predicted protein [Lichtheimia corymbifera JMRC:FSU:9682]
MVTTRKRTIAAAGDEQANVDSQSSAPTDTEDNANDNNTISQECKRRKKTTPLDQDQPDKVEQELSMEVVTAKATRRSKKATTITQVVVRRQPMRTCRVKAETANKEDTAIMDKPVPRTRKKKKEEENDPLIGHPKPALSMELWELILVELAHFSPSQLIELALASKAMYSMVMALPVWQKIISVSGIKPVPKRSKPPVTPYMHVFNHRARICEQCYGYGYLSGPKAALPVFSIEEGRRIRMCLPCRQAYYERHPEPVPRTEDDDEEEDENDRRQRRGRRRGRRNTRLITKLHGQDMFRLLDRHMDMIPYDQARNPHYRAAAPMRLYDIEDLRNHARHVHGGDVGIEAALARARTMAETRRRNVEIRRQRQEELRRQRREEVEARLASENLQQRTAINEVNQYIIHGRAFGFLNTIETLDEIIDLIRLREGRRAALVQRLEAENVPIYAYRDIFMRYVTHGVPDIDTAVARYVRSHGANTISQTRTRLNVTRPAFPLQQRPQLPQQAQPDQEGQVPQAQPTTPQEQQPEEPSHQEEQGPQVQPTPQEHVEEPSHQEEQQPEEQPTPQEHIEEPSHQEQEPQEQQQ